MRLVVDFLVIVAQQIAQEIHNKSYKLGLMVSVASVVQMAWYCDGYVAGLAIQRSQVLLPAVLLSGTTLGKLFTRVKFSLTL